MLLTPDQTQAFVQWLDRQIVSFEGLLLAIQRLPANPARVALLKAHQAKLHACRIVRRELTDVETVTLRGPTDAVPDPRAPAAG